MSSETNNLPEILFASFQCVDLGHNLLLFIQPEVLHLKLMLKAIDGVRDLCLGSVRQTGLQTCVLCLLYNQTSHVEFYFKT